MAHTWGEKDSVEQSFARGLRSARQAQGWSQQVLCDRMEATTGRRIDRTALARIEHGQQSPSMAQALALADALSTSVDSLVDRGREAGDEHAARQRLNELLPQLHETGISLVKSRAAHESAERRYAELYREVLALAHAANDTRKTEADMRRIDRDMHELARTLGVQHDG